MSNQKNKKMAEQTITNATFDEFQSQLKKEHGEYRPLQEKLAPKQNGGKTYQTCWVVNTATEERRLGVMKTPDHISLVSDQEAKNFKFKK